MNNVTAARRQKLLFEIYELLVDDMLRALKSGECKASMLDVVRKFLTDNGVTVRTIDDFRAGLERIAEDLKALPSFDPDDNEKTH